MGFLSSLFGGGSKGGSQSATSSLNKNDPLDVCYAFGVLATQVGAYDTSYVQAKVNSNDVWIQVLLDSDTCQWKGAQNLNNPQDLIKLGVSNDVANFVSSLNGSFKPYVLEVTIPHMNGAPTLKEIEENIMRSQRTAKLPVKYETQIAQNGIVLIQVRD